MPTIPVLVTVFSVGLACAAGQVRLGDTPADPAKERAQAVERAKTILAESLKVPESNIALESAKAATWPDASLGCPEKGRMYAQVVTSGWTVVLKTKGDRTHEVHVAARRAVICPAKEKAK